MGAFSALTEADERELRLLLEKRAPHAAIRAKAVAIVTNISGRNRSAGTVGILVGKVERLSVKTFLNVGSREQAFDSAIFVILLKRNGNNI